MSNPLFCWWLLVKAATTKSVRILRCDKRRALAENHAFQSTISAKISTKSIFGIFAIRH